MLSLSLFPIELITFQWECVNDCSWEKKIEDEEMKQFYLFLNEMSRKNIRRSKLILREIAINKSTLSNQLWSENID